MNQPNFNQTEIRFTLTIDEVNTILEAVGTLPFARVYQLVAKLQQQASQQLGEKGAVETHAG